MTEENCESLGLDNRFLNASQLYRSATMLGVES